MQSNLHTKAPLILAVATLIILIVVVTYQPETPVEQTEEIQYSTTISGIDFMQVFRDTKFQAKKERIVGDKAFYEIVCQEYTKAEVDEISAKLYWMWQDYGEPKKIVIEMLNYYNNEIVEYMIVNGVEPNVYVY